MSTQLALTYEPEALAAERGKDRAAAAHNRDLSLARSIALELAADGREISADDVRAEIARRPELGIEGPFDFMGSVFRGGDWRFAGYVKSRTPGSHANRLCLWRLR